MQCIPSRTTAILYTSTAKCTLYFSSSARLRVKIVALLLWCCRSAKDTHWWIMHYVMLRYAHVHGRQDFSFVFIRPTKSSRAYYKVVAFWLFSSFFACKGNRDVSMRETKSVYHVNFLNAHVLLFLVKIIWTSLSFEEQGRKHRALTSIIIGEMWRDYCVKKYWRLALEKSFFASGFCGCEELKKKLFLLPVDSRKARKLQDVQNLVSAQVIC